MADKAGVPQGVRDGFKRLFPNYDATKLKYPLRTEVMVAMCNVVQYAFGAYEDPKTPGFKEDTVHGSTIQHLNYETADRVVDGALKIHLKEATHVTDSDYGWRNSSDAYVAFSTGISSVKSDIIQNTEHPVWNSTHYLLLRKRQLRTDAAAKMTVRLYDSDKHDGNFIWKSIANSVDQDDFLGSAEIDLDQLKQPGVHSFNLELKTPAAAAKRAPKLSFTVEHISFEETCEEKKIANGTENWLTGTGTVQQGWNEWSDLSWILEFGHLTLDPFAFIEAPSTDTQVWLLVNCAAKTILVSFRGTETDKIKDIVLDLTAFRTRLGSTCQDNYVIEPTASIKDADILVHSGFLKGYESVREALLQVIYGITEWKEDWNICVTGHSLGGALATLCAFELCNRKNTEGSGPAIGMMNFGAPRVGNAAFARIYNSTMLESFRVVDQNDVVHLVPPFYTHTAKELLCYQNGEVFVEGVNLTELDNTVLTLRTLDDDADEDTGSLREVFVQYGLELDEMREMHGKPNYLSIIRAGVTNFITSLGQSRKSVGQ